MTNLPTLKTKIAQEWKEFLRTVLVKQPPELAEKLIADWWLSKIDTVALAVHEAMLVEEDNPYRYEDTLRQDRAEGWNAARQEQIERWEKFKQ